MVIVEGEQGPQMAACAKKLGISNKEGYRV